MLDLAIFVFGARAAVFAARVRWRVGIACAATALGVWLLLAAAGWYGRGAEEWRIHGAWMLVLLGPTATIRTAPFSAAAPLGEHATLVRSFAALVALSGFVAGLRRADAHSPLSDAFVHWNRAALGFLVVLLLTGGEVALFAIARLAAGE